MIRRIDRIQITAPDLAKALAGWTRLLGAEVVRRDRVEWIAADRTVLRLGSSEIELLDPCGIGIAAQHISRSRTALFSVGIAVSDLEAMRISLDARAIHHVVDGAQVYVTGEWLGIPGLRIVLSQDEEREPAGLVRHVYEATHLIRGYARTAGRLADVLGLDPSLFVPIRSEPYGYEGLLAMLSRDRLDRIEIVTPTDPRKTMGRYFARRGPSLYMIYAEAPDTGAIRARLLEHAPSSWTGPRAGDAPDNLFVHPDALGGVLLGVSRDGVAWGWSGRPDRAPGASSAA